jgi:HK97 gp10 family phage protein
MAKIQIKGLQEVLNALDLTQERVQNMLVVTFNEWANELVKIAKDRAPVNEGKLRQSIQADYATLNKLIAGVGVAVNYAAYLEFGTRGYAAAYVGKLPNDWQSYAATFKGKGGGSIDEMLLNIMDWVKSKQLSGTYSVKTQRRTGAKSARNLEDAEVAYPIALAILRKGIKAQPYLYPAYVEATNNLIKKLQKLS